MDNGIFYHFVGNLLGKGMEKLGEHVAKSIDRDDLEASHRTFCKTERDIVQDNIQILQKSHWYKVNKKFQKRVDQLSTDAQSIPCKYLTADVTGRDKRKKEKLSLEVLREIVKSIATIKKEYETLISEHNANNYHCLYFMIFPQEIKEIRNDINTWMKSPVYIGTSEESKKFKIMVDQFREWIKQKETVLASEVYNTCTNKIPREEMLGLWTQWQVLRQFFEKLSSATSSNKPTTAQTGGKKKTNRYVMIGTKKRVVFETANGNQYVKTNGQFFPISVV